MDIFEYAQSILGEMGVNISQKAKELLNTPKPSNKDILSSALKSGLPVTQILERIYNPQTNTIFPNFMPNTRESLSNARIGIRSDLMDPKLMEEALMVASMTGGMSKLSGTNIKVGNMRPENTGFPQIPDVPLANEGIGNNLITEAKNLKYLQELKNKKYKISL